MPENKKRETVSPHRQAFRYRLLRCGRLVKESVLCRGLLLGLVGLLLARLFTGVFEADYLEDATFDRRQRWRTSRRLKSEEHRVLVVAIDEKTTGVAGYNRWPLPRGEYARLLRTLKRSGARCLGFDILMEEPRPEEDAILARALRETGMAYLGVRFNPTTALFSEKSQIGNALDASLIRTESRAALRGRFHMKGANLPPSPLAGAARAMGSLTIVPESDGVVRKYPLVAVYVPEDPREPARLYASLPLLMAADLLGVPLQEVKVRLGDAVEIGNRRIPIDENGEVTLNYYGGYRSLYHLSYVDVANEGVYQPRYFTDKAVILGNTLPGGFDIQTTPYGGQYPGVEIQATVLQNILDGSAIAIVPAWVTWLLMIGGALGIGALRTRPILWQTGAAAALALLLVAVSYLLLIRYFLWLEIVRPALTVGITWLLVGTDTFHTEQWARARVQGAVETLGSVAAAIAHAHSPAEMVPRLESGIGRVLGVERVGLAVHDEELRRHLLLTPLEDASDGTRFRQRTPLVLHGKEVGHLAVQSAAGGKRPGARLGGGGVCQPRVGEHGALRAEPGELPEPDVDAGRDH